MSTRIPEDEFDVFKEHSGIGKPQSENEELLVLAAAFLDSDYDIASFVNEISQDSQLMKPIEEKRYAFPSASLKILRRCRRRMTSLKQGKVKLKSSSKLSVNDIIELAASLFIQSNSKAGHELSTMRRPIASKNAEDIQLVQDLLSCADKVSNRKYVCASKIIEDCKKLSLSQTSVVQRLVFYFIEALCDKIEHETGKSKGKGMLNSWPLEKAVNPSEALALFHQKMPFNQVSQFTSIQLMADHISDCRKIHIIDVEVYSGLQLSILMQTLAARSECRLLHFKITAVVSHSNILTKEAGVLLRNLADSLNLTFSFFMITLEDFLHLENNFYDQDYEEAVIVHAAFALKHLIVKPRQLESLMTVIRNFKPLVMIIEELETNANSPDFVNRFVDALFFYGAYFDSMEDMLKNDVEVRGFAESELFSTPLRNSVAAEGDERTCRSVSIDVWRAFFDRFGMVETKLSTTALDNANLVLKMFDCKDSCTLGLNGKSLVVSWKETPILSISAWMFTRTLPIQKTID